MRTLNHLHTPTPWKDCESSSVLGPSSSSVLHTPAMKSECYYDKKKKNNNNKSVYTVANASMFKMHVLYAKKKSTFSRFKNFPSLSLALLHHQSIRINETSTPVRSSGCALPSFWIKKNVYITHFIKSFFPSQGAHREFVQNK